LGTAGKATISGWAAEPEFGYDPSIDDDAYFGLLPDTFSSAQDELPPVYIQVRRVKPDNTETEVVTFAASDPTPKVSGLPKFMAKLKKDHAGFEQTIDVEPGYEYRIYAVDWMFLKHAVLLQTFTTGVKAIPCSPVDLPAEDLTVHYENVLSGAGDVRLKYMPPTGGYPAWYQGECSPDHPSFTLTCNGGGAQLGIYNNYPGYGTCPPTASPICASFSSAPNAINISSSSANPFSIVYSITSSSCPTFSYEGYTTFTLKEAD
jgi:hypothetical protein